MKKSVKLTLIVLCLCLAFTALAGCGGDGDGNGDKFEFDRNEDIILVQREAGSGSRTAFEELFGGGSAAPLGVYSGASVKTTTGAIKTTVAANEYAIGYISAGAVDSSIKELKIDGKLPTIENLKSGEYAYARPFLMLTKKGQELTSMTALAQDFYKYVYSTQGQLVVKGADLVDVTATSGSYSTPGGLSGTLTLVGSTSMTEVMEKLAEAYKKLNAGVTINVEGGGSGAGRTEAAKGLNNVFGLASANLTAAQEETLTAHVMAIDGIALIVHKDNPLTELTKAQVADIFERTKSGASKWSFIIAE